MQYSNPLTKRLFLALLGAWLAVASVMVHAEEPWLRPYVLVSSASGDVKSRAAEVKSALTAAGFEVAGSYSPYAGAEVIGATNDSLKAIAAKSEFGGYGSVVRIAVTQHGDQVQTSYFNPSWMAAAYRMQGDLSGIKAALDEALGGSKQVFGAEEPGWKGSDLRKYHFMIFMPYFDDHNELADHGSYEEAIAAVEAGLAAGKGGTSKVYRVDVPGKQETVFGVALTGEPAGDEHVMNIIDFKDMKQTAHLPYELLVSGGKVYALHAKFRIAVNFPDLTMNTFMKISDAPDAIEEALSAAAHGK
ncbi:MAG: hypothetical protein PVF52_00455 [Granulosicoccaceae bacterium]|jgi:hypothetical protein